MRIFPWSGAQDALTRAIAYYQKLGCWNSRVTISREACESALDVFLYARLITKRHPYERVVPSPPDALIPPRNLRRR